MSKIGERLPGIVLAGIIAVAAWFLGKLLPIAGGPVFGLLLGMMIAFWKRPKIFDPGVAYTAKKILQYAIIFIGFGMNLFHVFEIGSQTLLLMVFTLTSAFLAAYFLGKCLKTSRDTTILIGVGTAICGGSAIAATAPVIGAKDEDVASAISTIFLFNVIAAFLFPFLGHLLGMTDYQFGLWAGTAVNDTSSVVAAGYTFSDEAGSLAVIVKLTRTLMILPITVALAMYMSRGQKTEGKEYKLSKIFPWFVLGFLLASVANTWLLLPTGTGDFLAEVGKFMIIMAMAAIGLNTNLIRLLKNGLRPILLGLCCWIVLAVTSLIVQYFLLGA
ncbi:MAG: YeiH family protein [Eubacteriales bacterium]|nr:YeiH family protein [Eubacteriales bacterium]MDD4390459.1 YeiH family protein [Eubacteriales bacterium]